MEKQVYITEEEQAKCKKVTDVFKELYEMEDILVLDAGRYGFVVLKYYRPNSGFDVCEVFTDGRNLFENLWEEWIDTKMYLMAKGTPLLEKGLKGVFDSLSEEAQAALIERKSDFALQAGISL